MPFILFLATTFLTGLNGCSGADDIINAGAVPDGKTLNTGVIQEAINRVSEHGGGTLVFPPGKFLTGAIILKSGVTLEIKKGAILMGSTNPDDYLSIQPGFVALRTGQPTKQLIFAENQKNISIIGEGTIDGQGSYFERAEENDDPGVTRPHLIQFIKCENVTIEGIRLRNSGGWMQHYLACKNLQIKGIDVYNHANYNCDGIDIDGCEDVVISDCMVDSDDDGICLKSTSPAISKNVIISNCVIKSHCNALKMGTESTGGFQNIAINNCVVSPSVDQDPIYGNLAGQSAISVEMVDGGILDGVVISNISISETSCPIFIRLGNRARKYTDDAPDPGMGILRNVSLSHIVATTSSKITSNITGIPGAYAENIMLSDVIINNLSDGSMEEAQIKVKENDKGYPTPKMFGDVLPASGFFVRHVKNITFNNVQVHLKGENHRPAFIFNDVQGCILNNPVITTKGPQIPWITKDDESQDIKLLNATSD